MPRSAPRPLTIVLACVLVAALSLVVADRPAYDPTAWLIWGRQISEGGLDTVAGPSWKPLPILVTAPAAVLGDDPAVWAWLVVARTGGLLALVFAYRLAARFGGPAGGVVAVAALVLAQTVVSGVTRGNSEGLLVALVLFAVLRELQGRRREALAAGFAAALVRPESWPFVGLYVLWRLVSAWRAAGRIPWRGVALAVGAGLAVLIAWFVPERIGSGDFFRAASRALEPVAGSPAQADRPFLAVFTNGAKALAYPVYALAVLAVADALRRRRWEVLGLAALATGWMVVVAVMAELGFTGNLRYVTLPASMVCVLAGAGTGVLVRLAGRRRWALALAVAAAAPGVVLAADSLGEEVDRVAADERLYDALPAAVARAGGVAAVNACGAVITGPFQTQAVAWALHRPSGEIRLRGTIPGTVFSRHATGLGEYHRFRLLHRGTWVVRQTCR